MSTSNTTKPTRKLRTGPAVPLEVVIEPAAPPAAPPTTDGARRVARMGGR